MKALKVLGSTCSKIYSRTSGYGSFFMKLCMQHLVLESIVLYSNDDTWISLTHFTRMSKNHMSGVYFRVNEILKCKIVMQKHYENMPMQYTENFYTPRNNEVKRWVYCFHVRVSVRPSVRASVRPSIRNTLFP